VWSQLTSLQWLMAAGSARAGKLGRWWMTEFLALFPSAVSKWLVGGGNLALVLEPRGDGVRLELMDEQRQHLDSATVRSVDYSPAAIEQFLEARSAHRNLAVGIRLPREQVFERKLVLPGEIARTLDDVVLRDLTARTPFRAHAVYHDYATTRSPVPGRIIVWQWVTRREFVEDMMQRLQLDPAKLAFIDVVPTKNGDEPTPRITLNRDDRGRRSSWVRTTAVALTATAMMIAASDLGLELMSQRVMLDDLDHQLIAAKARAEQVRGAMEKLEQKQAVLLRLRSRKREQPGLLDVWEETTRVLPSHSWLTEFRLVQAPHSEDRQVTMAGFSAAASSLVGLLDRSPMFVDASLTAPIALDPGEQRERFAIQARVKGQSGSQQAAR